MTSTHASVRCSILVFTDIPLQQIHDSAKYNLVRTPRTSVTYHDVHVTVTEGADMKGTQRAHTQMTHVLWLPHSVLRQCVDKEREKDGEENKIERETESDGLSS